MILVNTIAGWGGGESWTGATALALTARGHEVAVLARAGGALLVGGTVLYLTAPDGEGRRETRVAAGASDESVSVTLRGTW